MAIVLLSHTSEEACEKDKDDSRTVASPHYMEKTVHKSVYSLVDRRESERANETVATQ